MANKKASRASGAAPDQAPSDAVPDDVKYGAAVDEIEEILESIDRDEVDIDDLSVKVERAVALIRLCQTKLRATEAQVTQVLDELGEEMDGVEAEEGSDDPGADAVTDEGGATSRQEEPTGTPELEDDGLPF